MLHASAATVNNHGLKRQMASGTTLALLALLSLASLGAGAQEKPAITVQPNTIYVNAEGKFESEPDTARIQFNIGAQDKSQQAAYARAAKAAESMRQVLRANQVDVKSAELGIYSLEPVYDYSNGKRRIVGYRVSTSVSLRLKDFAKTGALVEQLSAIEDTENQSLSYALENIDAAKIKAIEDGFNRARAEASALARAGGRSLGELVYSSIDTSEPIRFQVPMARMSAGVAAQAPTAEFSAAKITVTARVDAVFQIH